MREDDMVSESSFLSHDFSLEFRRWGCGGHVDGVMRGPLANGTGCTCALPTPVKPFLVSVTFLSEMLVADSARPVVSRRSERQWNKVVTQRCMYNLEWTHRFSNFGDSELFTSCSQTNLRSMNEAGDRIESTQKRGKRREKNLVGSGDVLTLDHSLMIDASSC